MKQRSIEYIRNIGIVAHIDAGKTTTTERILYLTGRVRRLGEVHDGNATMDWMPEEKERGITITAASTACYWKGHMINIVDTPGHVDFTIEVERALRVLDGAVVILDAEAGVEPQTETVWYQADKYRVPRIVFINKMDKVGANPERTIHDIEQMLGATPLVLQIPIGLEQEFRGVVDVLTGKAYTFDEVGHAHELPEVPHDLVDDLRYYQELMLDLLTEFDETLMEFFVEHGVMDQALARKAIRRGTLTGRIVPVLLGSAYKNKGIPFLLDAITHYLPSPADLPPISGTHPVTGQEEIREPNENGPLTAFAFKVMTDPYVGKLVYVRVYSGTLTAGSYVYNATTGKKERISRILRMHANQREDIEELRAGDIGAILGLKHTVTGHTLTEPEFPLVLESIMYPEPVLAVSIQPVSKHDHDKFQSALRKILDEDPSLRLIYNEETGETLLSGMGELHLEIVASRLKREFHTPVKMGMPQVAYRETITRPVTVEGKFIKQTGGRGQYGHVVLMVEPLERGSGVIFEERLRGSNVPREYVPAVEKGVRKALEKGVIAEYPVIDVRVVLLDGSHHEVDSSDIAFQEAARRAILKALAEAHPILLEPIMKVEVRIPEAMVGDVIGDLGARRGQVTEILDRGQNKVIRARIPLAELLQYATDLRSLTRGRGSFSMEFESYQPVSEEVTAKVLRTLRREDR